MTVPKTNDRTKTEWQVRGRTWNRVGPFIKKQIRIWVGHFAVLGTSEQRVDDTKSAIALTRVLDLTKRTKMTVPKTKNDRTKNE